MQDLNVCHISPVSGNIMTPEGVILSDKFLLSPSGNTARHQLEIAFPPSANLTLLKNEMGKIAMEKLKGDAVAAKNMVNKRFLDPNNKPNGGKPLGERFNGWTLIRASADYLPDFVHPSGKKIDPNQVKTELYRGRWGRATVNAYWMDTKTKDGTLVKGIFLGLVNIQLLRHDEPIGFTKVQGEEEFGAVNVGDNSSVNVSTGTASMVDSLFE